MIKRLSILLLLLATGISPALGLELKLKEKAEVQGRMVTLGEVAELRGAAGADAALAELELFPAPEPGQEAVQPRPNVARFFEQRTIGRDDVRWSGAAAVTVRRAGTEIGPERIEQVLQEFLAENRARLPEASIRIKSLQQPRPFALPAGKLTHEVIPSDPDILASRRFTILFRVDGRVVQNLAVRAELEALAPVVVAAHDLGRGIALANADLRVVERDLSGLRNPCLDPRELLGKKLKRPLRAGDAVDRTQVEFPPMIRRGEVVAIQVNRGGLNITASGEARQDGREGETIRVRNSASRKEILCRVVAPGVAEVEY